MSRCFPYPSPSYICNRATGDALIESIKIGREREIINQERKEQKRREKEQKKKEKKEKKWEKEKLKSIQARDGINKRKLDSDRFDNSVNESSHNSKELHLLKKNDLEAEQLERSGLTEEYGQPVLLDSLCYSSDGTQSKTKRCRIEQSPSNLSCTTQGKAIRFRLKRREPENAQPTDDNPSTSGRTCNSNTQIFDAPPAKDERCVVATAPSPDKGTKDIISRAEVQVAFKVTPIEQDTSPICSSSNEKIQKPKSAYEALFSEWVPPAIHFDSIEGDDDVKWLFPSYTQAAQNRGSLKAYHSVSGQPRASPWPRAHLLPEVDLVVLPFTVPF